MATFLDSDENFMIYRRFGYLHSRMLLRLQDKLRTLESRLDENDNDDEDSGDQTQKLCLMSRGKDEAACRKLAKQEPGVQTRTHILDEIELVLGKYGNSEPQFQQSVKKADHGADEWVLKAKQMVSLNRPAERDYQSAEALLYSKKPLLDEEYGFIYQKEDLITLRDGREMAVLDSLTERLLRTFHCSLSQVSTPGPEDTDDMVDNNSSQKIFCTKVNPNFRTEQALGS